MYGVGESSFSRHLEDCGLLRYEYTVTTPIYFVVLETQSPSRTVELCMVLDRAASADTRETVVSSTINSQLQRFVVPETWSPPRTSGIVHGVGESILSGHLGDYGLLRWENTVNLWCGDSGLLPSTPLPVSLWCTCRFLPTGSPALE